MDNEQVLRCWESWNGSIVCSKSGETFTADRLRALTEKTVETFQSINIHKGDVVVLSLKNTVTFPVCFMALLYIKANILLLSSNATGFELSRFLDIHGFKWIIRNSDLLPLQGMERVHFENVLVDNLLVCENRYTVSKITASNYLTLPQDGVIIHQTSGTYGRPMLCVRNQEVAIAEGVNYVSSIPAYNNIKIRITTPLNHAFSYGFGLMSSIITNSTLIMDESFNPKKVLKEETNETSDILCVVPPMLRSLMQLKKRDASYLLPKMTFYAGSSCQSQVAEEFVKTFDSNLYAILGSTETGAISSSYGCRENNCGVGKLLNNVEIDIVNKEENYQGYFVGDLKVKSTSMMQGYCSDSDYRNIEWFSTGDLATYDANGNLHIVGRKRDLINVGGVKIDSYEIEEIIRSYPGVDDCVVYSGAAQNGEEAIFACISSSVEIKTPELMHYCSNLLSRHKLPNRVLFIDKIPRTESGKCLKTLLPQYFHNTNPICL